MSHKKTVAPKKAPAPKKAAPKKAAPKEKAPVPKHVDTFIWNDFLKEPYARWVLMHFRLPAAIQVDFGRFMAERHLFCDYAGSRYRVTGASRFGDVWLHSDFKVDTGYEHRVAIDSCSNWGPTP